MRPLVLALLVCVGCANKPADQAPPADDRPPRLPATELQRGRDACRAYVDQVCACTAPAAAEACRLARALPDALQLGIEVSTSPDSNRSDVLHANDSIRKAVKECIEQTAKLPALGC